MSKKIMIKSTLVPNHFPIGATIVTWLFYKQLNPHGTAKGVVLTLFITWLIIIWGVVTAQVFTSEFKEPVWKEL